MVNKIKKQFPEAKFGPKRKYGFAPTDPEYGSVFRFVERGYKKAFPGLQKYMQEELKAFFPDTKFNFNREGSKYGVSVKDPNYPKISKISIPVFKYGAPAAIGEPIVATTGDRTLLQIAEKSGENIFGEKFFIPGVSDIPDFDDPNLTPKDRALKLLRQKSQFGAEAPLVVGGLSAGFEGLFKFATPYALKAGSIGKTYLGKGYDVAA